MLIYQLLPRLNKKQNRKNGQIKRILDSPKISHGFTQGRDHGTWAAIHLKTALALISFWIWLNLISRSGL